MATATMSFSLGDDLRVAVHGMGNGNRFLMIASGAVSIHFEGYDAEAAEGARRLANALTDGADQIDQALEADRRATEPDVPTSAAPAALEGGA